MKWGQGCRTGTPLAIQPDGSIGLKQFLQLKVDARAVLEVFVVAVEYTLESGQGPDG